MPKRAKSKRRSLYKFAVRPGDAFHAKDKIIDAMGSRAITRDQATELMALCTKIIERGEDIMRCYPPAREAELNAANVEDWKTVQAALAAAGYPIELAPQDD